MRILICVLIGLFGFVVHAENAGPTHLTVKLLKVEDKNIQVEWEGAKFTLPRTSLGEANKAARPPAEVDVAVTPATFNGMAAQVANAKKTKK